MAWRAGRPEGSVLKLIRPVDLDLSVQAAIKSVASEYELVRCKVPAKPVCSDELSRASASQGSATRLGIVQASTGRRKSYRTFLRSESVIGKLRA